MYPSPNYNSTTSSAITRAAVIRFIVGVDRTQCRPAGSGALRRNGAADNATLLAHFCVDLDDGSMDATAQ
jgi:hypothetical protein